MPNPRSASPAVLAERATLLHPIDGEAVDGASVLFIWRDMAADAYQLEVAADEAFEDVRYNALHTENRARLFELFSPDDAVYFWRVRAQQGDDWGAFSEPAFFRSVSAEELSAPRKKPARQGIPVPVAPIGNAPVDGGAVPLRWRSVPGARAYQIQVGADRDFSDPVVDLTLEPSNSLTLYGLLPESGTPFFWRVRCRGTKDWSHWSRTARFRAVPDAVAEQYGVRQEAARTEALRLRRRWAAEQAALTLAEPHQTGVTSKTEVLLILLMMVFTLAFTAFLIIAAIG